jgi:2-keto-3-deoxy-L-fuconate dehydrogenase
MEHPIKGKTVLVTAAAQGIGNAIAVLFAKAGAKVVATDINETLLKEIDGKDGIKALKLNVLDDAAVKALVAAEGPFEVLVNAAGVVHAGSIVEMPDADLEFAFDLNVKSMIRTIRAVLPTMLASPRRPCSA